MPKLEIYNRKNFKLVAESFLEEKNGKYTAQMLVPCLPMEDALILVDGQVMSVHPGICDKPQIMAANQIKETYWTYGENHTCLSSNRKRGSDTVWKSKYCNDLNLHIVTNEGNDGKIVKLVLKTHDNREINLRKIVSENKAVFDKVFEE